MTRMDIYSLPILQLSALLFLLIGKVGGLKCWHCIADNCEQDPADNYKAIQNECQQGQQCQKVFFEMQSDIKAAKYSSTVRSCAEQCEDQDDFLNCTEWQYITRGCVRRTCCNDDDLCNSAHAQRHLLSGSVCWAIGVAVLASWSLLVVLMS